MNGKSKELANTQYSSMASSINAPAVPAVNAEFDNDSGILSSLVVSIFVLGFLVGSIHMAGLLALQSTYTIYKWVRRLVP